MTELEAVNATADQLFNLVLTDTSSSPSTTQPTDPSVLSLATLSLTDDVSDNSPQAGAPTAGDIEFNHGRRQETYKGFRFDIPAASLSGPFYLVTRGYRVGIFSDWFRVSPHINGVKDARFDLVPAGYDAAHAMMLQSIDLGEAQLVTRG